MTMRRNDDDSKVWSVKYQTVSINDWETNILTGACLQQRLCFLLTGLLIRYLHLFFGWCDMMRVYS